MSNTFNWRSNLDDATADILQKYMDDGKIKPLTVGGNTSPVWDYMGRPVAMLQHGNTEVPFYVSSGSGGKKNVKAGLWYPFAGIGIMTDWLNKGSQSDINNYYNNKGLRDIAESLDRDLGTVNPSKVPRITMKQVDEFATTVNQSIGLGRALDNYGQSVDPQTDPYAATKNRILRRFENIRYKGLGFKNIPYQRESDTEFSDAFRDEYESKYNTKLPPKTTPSTTTNVNTSAVATPQSPVTPSQTPITPTPATKTTAQPSKKTSSSAPSSKNNTTVTKKTPPSTPSFTQGQSAFWKGPDYDFPVTFGNSFQGEDGKMYANVTNHMGGKSIVPLDQLFADEKGFDPKNVSQSADPTNVRNIKSKNKTKPSSSKPKSTVSNTTTSSSVKGQTVSDKPYYSPETPRANPNSPLEGLHKKSFHNQLKGMGIYVLDVETTGVKSSDKMFSSGRVRIDRKGNQIGNQAVESFYDVGSGGAIDRKHFKTEAEYQEALEKNLARAHSSKKFGNEQKERGSLAGHAKARISGELTTPAQFLSDFEQDIANNQKGSIIWGHNNQFENKQFDTEKLGSDEYSDVHRRMEARNIVNGSGLFGQSRTMSNKNTDPNMKGLTQKATNLLYNDVNKSILSQNPDKLRAALGKYAAANVDIINEVQNQIEAVRLKSGKYTVGDSLHLSRALMSFGAVTDQFDPRNLMFGNKIETLAHVMLGGYQETHQALDDAIVQGKITSRLTEEIDKFRADPNYKSQLVADMNKHITENRGKLANDTFKSSIMRELQEVKHLGDTDGLTKTYDWIRKTTENYSVIEEHAADRAAYAEQFKQALDKAYREKEATADTVKASMEKFIEQNQVEGAASRINGPERAKDGKSIMKKALDGKKKFIAIGGGLAAANLFLGGGEKGEDKKYNTYDELYNNQYYGSGFADWQERNNAHKILY